MLVSPMRDKGLEERTDGVVFGLADGILGESYFISWLMVSTGEITQVYLTKRAVHGATNQNNQTPRRSAHYIRLPHTRT